MGLGRINSSLVLEYTGEDNFSMPVFRDQFNHLWKDIDLGRFEQPSLYSVLGNEIDGDPNEPIAQDFTIQKNRIIVSEDKRFQYQMLGRIKCDCDYYLGYGNRNPDCLWAKTEKKQIEVMKEIWLGFSEDEKPEWLTWEQIEVYEKDMVIQQ